VKLFRTLPTKRLLLLIGAVAAVVAVGATIGIAAIRDTGTPPPPQPLANAIHDALTGPNPDGVTGYVTFTNNLLPSGSLLGNVGSALMTGASGRFWVTNDGRGRIELQSNAGDVQIVWSPDKLSVYDASSNTAYELALPAQSSTTTTDNGTPPTVDDISSFLSHVAEHAGLSDAVPGVVAAQGAYTVEVTPKDNPGLFGPAELAWDAINGTPLKLAIYAKGSAAPALSLEATDISFAPVADEDVNVSPPPRANVVDLSTQLSSGTTQSGTEVTGLAAVQAAVPFTIVAPDTLNGQARSDVRLAGESVLVVYGDGLGSIVLVERAADTQESNGAGMLGALPTVSIGTVTAHELATELGTVLQWQNNGVSFVLAGSVSPADAEAAAGALG
jgi:hypothetical protein